MTTQTITAARMETLCADHTTCCGAVIEFEGQWAHLVLAGKHGGHLVAPVGDEVPC